MFSKFVIGVYSQQPWGNKPDGTWSTTAGFEKWKNLGFNTVVGWENGGMRPNPADGPYISYDAMLSAAATVGLSLIVPLPETAQAAAAIDPSVIGIINAPKCADVTDPRYYGRCTDEPDLHPSLTTQNLVDEYKRIKAFSSKPVYLNFSSSGFIYNKVPGGLDWYTKVIQNACDCASCDLYPIGGWKQPGWQDSSVAPDDATKQVGAGPMFNSIIEKLFTCGCKQQFGYVELGQVDANKPAASPDEIRGQIWAAVLMGCEGVLYFPQTGIGGYLADSSTDAQKAVAAESNGELAILSDVLTNGTYARRPVAAPFMSASWTYQGKQNVITLNNSHSVATLDGVSFAPYQVQLPDGSMLGADAKPTAPTTAPTPVVPPDPPSALAGVEDRLMAAAAHISAIATLLTEAKAMLDNAQKQSISRRARQVTVTFEDGSTQQANMGQS